MRIEVLTSLYPGPPRPFEGVFAERRWLGMRGRGHEVSVTQPLPRTPGPFVRGKWAEIRRMPAEEVRAGIPVTRPRYFHLPGRDRSNVRRFAAAGWERLSARARPDVVVADYAWPAAAIAPLLAEHGIPCVVSGRGSDVLQVAGEAGLGDLLRSFLRAAGHWCAVSADLVAAMDELGGAPGRGHLVPNGVDFETFRIRERAGAREGLGLSVSSTLVLVVGHLIERKDPLLALEVFLNGAPEDARCVFCGRGPLREALERRIREAGAQERIQLLGEVEPADLASWYAAADCLLLTSKREGRPNVVLEALACGRPVLATAAGGTGELLSGWEQRLLSTSRDASALGSMLESILKEPPRAEDLRASIEHLSWDASLSSLEACLSEAVEGGSER